MSKTERERDWTHGRGNRAGRALLQELEEHQEDELQQRTSQQE